MKKPVSSAFVLVFWLLAASCSSDDVYESPTFIPSFTPKATIVLLTKTSTLTPTLTLTSTPADPRIRALEAQGYVLGELLRFEIFSPQNGATFFSNLGEFFGNLYGGPQFNVESPPNHLDYQESTGKRYSYLQYIAEDGNNCHLLFYQSEGLLADIDVSLLNDRINNIITSPADTMFPAPLFCLPGDWGDINGNYLPDIPVILLWGNNYTGGEVHIFEVVEDDTVIDLTADLPGAMSHWYFNAEHSEQMVVDLAWAFHDCIYPQAPFSFWVFDWNGRKYVDMTASGYFNFTGYIDDMKDLVESRYGEPFDPFFDIGPIVSILLMYDKMELREEGWQVFLEMVSMGNWPGTSSEDRKWLQNDVAHFTAQYNSGLPFTPNDYCNQQENEPNF